MCCSCYFALTVSLFRFPWLTVTDYVVEDEAAERMRLKSEAILKRRHRASVLAQASGKNDEADQGEHFPFLERVLQVDIRDTIAGRSSASSSPPFMLLSLHIIITASFISLCYLNIYIYINRCEA
jgi:hypothetical protein